jgi:secreted trypsin-like serine protease
MAMRRAFPFFVALGLVGCSFESGAPERFGTDESEIINGQVDTTHDAVVAVFAQQSGCSATIIHVAAGNAFVLTAAHCFGFGALEVVVIGDDYNNPDAVLSVVDYQIHPQYDPQESTFDFAMVTAAGAGPSTPVIPALRPSEDNVQVGTPLDHVGYGLLSYPNGSTSVRHHAMGQVDQVGSIQIGYAQPSSGPCQGDSGGPNLVTVAGGERVAGVISFGDQGCSEYGVSGRVTAAYDSFIGPYTGNPEPVTASSSSTSTGSGAAVGAGGSGSGPTSGAGASDDWVAGNTNNQDFDGEVQSGCNTSGGRSASGVLVFLATLFLFRLVLSRLAFFPLLRRRRR